METDGKIAYFPVSTSSYHSNPLVTMVTDDFSIFNFNNDYLSLQYINFFLLVMEQEMIQRHPIILIWTKKVHHLFLQK